MANVQINPSGAWNASSLVGPLPNFYANQVTGAFTAVAGNVYSCSPAAAFVASLPDATLNAGAVIAVVNVSGAHAVTVESAVSGQTVGGQSSLSLGTAADVVLVVSDGSNYLVLASVLT